jgi:hypothetical protein
MFMKDVVGNALTELTLSGTDGVEYSLTNQVYGGRESPKGKSISAAILVCAIDNVINR